MKPLVQPPLTAPLDDFSWKSWFQNVWQTASSLWGRVNSTNNLLINGAFQVWQRGTSFGPFTGAALYAADRWRVSCGPNISAYSSRQAGSVPARYCIRVHLAPGDMGTDWIQILQAVTTDRVLPLRGKRLGTRFRARRRDGFSGSLNRLIVRLVTGTGTDDLLSVGTGSAVFLDYPVELSEDWTEYIVDFGKVLPTTVSTLYLSFYYVAQGPPGEEVIDGFELEEVQLVPVDDGFFNIGPFFYRSFEEELAACLPYFEKSFPYATAPAQNAGTTGAYYFSQIGGAAASQNGPAMVPFTVTKRISPTVPTLYNPSAANAQIRNTATGTDFTLSISAVTNVNGWLPQGTSPAGSNAGNACVIHWTADAEL